MTLADQYARALFETVAKNPFEGLTYLKNLHMALKRRGHEKLLPRILKSYEHQEANAKRNGTKIVSSPEERRTKILVELYKKLITS